MRLIKYKTFNPKITADYYELYISCPVCYHKGLHQRPSYYQHQDCGGHLYIGDNAHVYCDKCESNKHITFWHYTHRNNRECGNTLILSDNPRSNGEMIAEDIGIAGQLTLMAGVHWLQRFLVALETTADNNVEPAAEKQPVALNKIEKDGSIYYELYASCPICYDDSHIIQHFYHKHHECGGQLYVGDNAHIYCDKCEIQKPISQWQIGCNHNEGFIVNTKSAYTWVPIILMSGELCSSVGFEWLQKMLANAEASDKDEDN